MRLFSLAIAAGIASTATAQTFVIPTIPSSTTTTEAASSTAYPWGRGTAQIRVQYIYDSTHFTSQSLNYPIVINNLRFRANGAAAQAGGTYTNATIMMSTAAVDYATPSTTFANNHGTNVATVHTGSVTVATGAGTTPNNWYVAVPITPFLYDPTQGDLCIDMMHDGVGPTVAGPAHDCATTGSLCSRMYNLTTWTSPTGSVQQNVALVIELGYTPANGLFAGFNANVTSGASPLAVNFTSTSFSSDPGGITSYAWDFDGDAVTDSVLPNPSFVYTNCGTYTVSLTVTDATHPPSTLTRTNYITTDAITANFSNQVVGPLTVQFTDTSTPAATSWAWDLNGDSVVDSNAQNPVWVYPNGNPVNVTLTASRLCGAPSVVTKSVTGAQTLSTNLAANNGAGTPATLYFNLDILNPAGVSISSFDTITSTISTAFTADVYLKNGTYSGFELNAAPWTLVGTASGITAPVANLPANSAFPTPLYMPQGSYGVAIRYVGAYPRYVTQTAPVTWSNGDLALTAGSASLSTAGAFTGTSLLTPRSWSGTLYYGTHNVTSQAGYGWFGKGCPGTLGQTSVVATSQPQLGGTLQTSLNNLQFGIAVMVVGLSNQVSGGVIPLPFDLGVLGAPGCPLRVSLDVTDTVVGAGTTANWNFAIPLNPALSGFKLYNQAASLDTVNAFGFALSHGYGWIVGN